MCVNARGKKCSNLYKLLLRTGGVVEDLSFRTPAGLVERKHRHHIRVATLALVGTVVAGGVAARLVNTVCSFDEGFVAVSIRHRVPCKHTVSPL